MDRTSQRQRVKAMLEQALADGISEFEVIGRFNYEYLPSCIRKVVVELWIDIFDKRAEERKIYKGSVFREMRLNGSTGYIKVTMARFDDRLHVFCHLDPGYVDRYLDKVEEAAKQEKRELLSYHENWNERQRRKRA